MSFERVGRRVFLIGAAGAGLLACSSSTTGPSCATPSTGPGLPYCLVGKKKLTVPDGASLAVGEAVIMSIDDNSAAVVARDAGGFYALSATCPHACCTVALCSGASCTNPILSANDCGQPKKGPLADAKGVAFLCPCHGSEFGPDGSVLTGPAISGLPAVALELSGTSVIVDLATPVATSLRVKPA
jgi:Rieske Fe-S protein